LDYFIFASILSAVIGFEILVFSKNKSKFFLASILLQILVLSAGLRWGVLSEFPSFVGSDPWYHSVLTEYVINNGHVIPQAYRMPWTSVQPSTFYSSFPFMHLIEAMTSLTTSISSNKLSSAISIGVFEVASLLFVFLIARKILEDSRLALFSTLFLGVSNWHIVFGISLVPQSLGYGFFALLIYLLVRQGSKPTRSGVLMILLTICSIILSHTLTAFVVCVIFLSFYLSKVLYQHLIENLSPVQQKIGATLPVTLLAVVSVLFYWIFYTNFFTERVDSFIRDLTTRAGIASPVFKSYLHYEFDQTGIYLLYVFAIIGCLLWLRKEKRSALRTTFIISGAILLSVIYGSWLLGFRTFYPERWFVFAFIVLVVPAAEGLRNLLEIAKKRKVAILAVSMLIFSLTLLMITTGDANRDNPLFGKQEVELFSYSESELRAADRIANLSRSIIYTDQSFSDVFSWSLKREMMSINFIDFDQPKEGIVVERQYIYEHPIQLAPFGPYIIVNRTFESNLESMNKVYCNGRVSAYTSTRR
jgi:hypothetical protein